MANKQNYISMLVLAGLFIGLGIGIAIDQTAAGVLIGLGAGLLVASIGYMITK
ncbi:hypothetical protein ACFL21_04570 [Patescibacteria group bacterium]